MQERIKGIVVHLRGERSKSEWLILLAFGTLVAMGGLFAGYQLDTTVVHAPVQAVGICPSPAHIDGSSCVNTQCTLDQNNHQVCTSYPAGYIYSYGGIVQTTTTTSSCIGPFQVCSSTTTSTTSTGSGP